MKPGIRRFMNREAEREYGKGSEVILVRNKELKRGNARCRTFIWENVDTLKEVNRQFVISVSPEDVARWDRSKVAQLVFLHELGHAFYPRSRMPDRWGDHFTYENWVTIYGFRRFGRRLAPHLGVSDLLRHLFHVQWEYSTDMSMLLRWLPIGWYTAWFAFQVWAMIVLTRFIFGHG